MKTWRLDVTDKKLSNGVWPSRKMAVQESMKNMADFFGAMATPVDFTIEGESNTVSAESLLDQIEDAHRQISEARIKEIREVLKVLSPGVEQDVLGRITDRSLILVPAHMIEPDLVDDLPSYIAVHRMLPEDQVVLIFDADNNLLASANVKH